MSAPLIVWRHALLEDERLTPMEKLVAFALSVFWDANGRKAYPSAAKLARKLGTSGSTVRRALRRLRALGILEADVRPGKTTVYHAVLPYPTLVTHDQGPAEDGEEPWSSVTRGVVTHDQGPLSPVTTEVGKEVATEAVREQHHHVREQIEKSLERQNEPALTGEPRADLGIFEAPEVPA